MIIVDENELTYGTLSMILDEAFVDEIEITEDMKVKYTTQWLENFEKNKNKNAELEEFMLTVGESVDDIKRVDYNLDKMKKVGDIIKMIEELGEECREELRKYLGAGC